MLCKQTYMKTACDLEASDLHRAEHSPSQALAPTAEPIAWGPGNRLGPWHRLSNTCSPGSIQLENSFLSSTLLNSTPSLDPVHRAQCGLSYPALSPDSLLHKRKQGK